MFKDPSQISRTLLTILIKIEVDICKQVSAGWVVEGFGNSCAVPERLNASWMPNVVVLGQKLVYNTIHDILGYRGHLSRCFEGAPSELRELEFVSKGTKVAKKLVVEGC